jgi:hypothetical protein
MRLSVAEGGDFSAAKESVLGNPDLSPTQSQAFCTFLQRRRQTRTAEAKGAQVI